MNTKKNHYVTHGTSHFVSRAAAIEYYRPYGYTTKDVDNELIEGAIRIGEPPLEDGDVLSIIKGEGRYQITREC